MHADHRMLIGRPIAAMAGSVRRLIGDSSAVAYVEMALMAPLLIAMYCGAFVVSDMVTCARKVSITARAITDLTTEYASLSPTDLGNIMTNAAYVMAPYNASNAGMRISEVQVTGASTATVVWSQGQNATALTVGSTVNLPSGMAPAEMIPNAATGQTGAYFIMGEISYPYTPLFGGSWLPAPSLYNRYFMLPRIATPINLTS